MEYLSLILSALNPATGTQLPLPLFIISGVVLVGIIAFTIVSKVLKKNNMNSRGKRKKK